MAEVVLFHHVHGLTPGVVAFADRLRGAGHTVHVPDLYDGRTFDDMEEGFAHAQSVDLQARAQEVVAGLPSSIVYGGFSLGVMAAQMLAQHRPGARGAVLLHACVPPSALGAPWPDGVPVQVHGMDADPFFADEGDLDAARELVASVAHAELFVYPGDQHLFTDSSLPAYRADAAELVLERVVTFLADVDRHG